MNRINVTLVVLTASILFGCGRETLQDNVSREIDRSSENASVLSKRYQAVVGRYTTDDTQDTSPFWINMEVRKLPVQKDGYLTPQPSLAGSVILWNKVPGQTFADAQTGDMKAGVNFSFKNGMYDQGTQTLVAQVSATSGDPIQVSCNSSGDTLNCDWQPNGGGATAFSFVMVKVPGSQTSAKSGK